MRMPLRLGHLNSSGSDFESTDDDSEDIPVNVPDANVLPRRLDVDCSFGVSNDELEECPFPRSYGCLNRQFQDRMVVLFDYEVYYTSVLPPLDYIQGSLLEHVASSLSVTEGCSLRRKLQELPSITALSLTPDDIVNSNATCTAPIETAIRQTATCRVMQGQMTIWVPSTTDPLIVTSHVLREVRSIMSNDLLLVDTPAGSIEKVIFMGQRGVEIYKTTSDPSSLTQDTFVESTDVDQPISGAGIASLVVFIASVLLCMLFTYGKLKKDSENQSEGMELSSSVILSEKHSDVPLECLETTLPYPHHSSSSSGSRSSSSCCGKHKDSDDGSIIIAVCDIKDPTCDSPVSMMVAIPSGPMNESLNDDDDDNLLNNSYNDEQQTQQEKRPPPKQNDETKVTPPISPTRTLANLSEPTPVTSWIDEEDDLVVENKEALCSPPIQFISKNSTD